MGLFLEKIAESADRANVDSSRLELATEAMDVNLDRVRSYFFVPPVKLFRQLLLVHDAAAPHHQHLEHAQLASGEVERFTAERRTTAGCVEHE
jgi:hypothetical protein